MSQVGTTQTLRDRIEARRAALAQTAGAAPEPSLRDRIAARRAALGGTAQPAARQTPGTLTGSVSGYEQPTGAGAFQRPAVAQPEPSQGIIENFGIGIAQRLPIAAADVLTLVRGGFEASNDPAAAVLPAVGNTLDMVSPGLQGAGGDLANQAVNTLAAPPRSPMLNAVSGALGERTDVLRTIGNAPVAAYDAATGGTPSPFSGAGIARAAGGTVIDMGASMGGGFVGGVVGGPAGAAAGAFAPNMLSQWASGMAETANRIMEANPDMDQREALARAFGVSGTAAVPAAMLDSLTGAEGAVAKIGTNTLGRTIRQGVVTGAKAVVKEAATEPGQSVIQHFGSLAAQPIVGQLPNDAVEQYAKERAAEALIGGLMGGAGGGASVVMDRMGGSNGRNGDPTQGRNVAGRGPVGRATSGMESPAAQQQQARGVAPGVPGMVGPQGAPAGTQPGDVAGERSVPLMADLAGDWERQAEADAERDAAYTERLWDELAPQEQVAAEKADPSVMPGATGQVAPPLPGVEEAPAEVVDEAVAPSGRQLSPDGMSNLRRKMIARREMLRASSQARQMQAEQDATIGRQVAPVDRSAADAIAEGYDLLPDGGNKVADKSPVEAAPSKHEEWSNAREARVKASKEAGNEHLDQKARYVENSRGREIYSAHDPKERGVIRTVANTGEVVVFWNDKYSADKNLATEKTQKAAGKKKPTTVYESWLMPSDLQDYVFAEKPTPAPTPETSREEAAKKPKPLHEMTRDERMAEADRLSRDPVMHTPLINEGAISPTQINRMGNREKAKWQENGQRKMMNLARIRDLRQTDEQIAAAKTADDARKAESAEIGQRSRYQFLKALEPNGFRGIKGSKKAYRAEFEALKAKFEPAPNSPAIPDSSANSKATLTSSPKTERPPVASMDRAALLAELGEKVTGTVKKLRDLVASKRSGSDETRYETAKSKAASSPSETPPAAAGAASKSQEASPRAQSQAAPRQDAAEAPQAPAKARSDSRGKTPSRSESAGPQSTQVQGDSSPKGTAPTASDLEALRELSKKADGKGYVPQSDEQMARLRELGLIDKSKAKPRLTEAGRSALYNHIAETLAAEMKEGAEFDARQLELMRDIEAGRPITRAESIKYFSEDSGWRDMAKIVDDPAPTEPVKKAEEAEKSDWPIIPADVAKFAKRSWMEEHVDHWETRRAFDTAMKFYTEEQAADAFKKYGKDASALSNPDKRKVTGYYLAYRSKFADRKAGVVRTATPSTPVEAKPSTPTLSKLAGDAAPLGGKVLSAKASELSDKLGAERAVLSVMGKVPAEHKALIVSVEEADRRVGRSGDTNEAGREVSPTRPLAKVDIGDRTRKLRDFIREVPEFALDPHFIVAKVQDGRAVLRFQDGGRYSFAADAIGISFEVPPTVGQRVEIDLKAVKSMKHGESWIIAEPTGKAPSDAIKTEMAQRAGIAADDVGTEGTTSRAKKLIGWANQTEADARAKLRDKAKKQKGKMSSGIDPIEQAETAYQIGRWAAALVVRGGVKVAQAVYQIVGKVGPVQLRTRRAAEAITNQIIEAAGKDPTDAALTIAAGDVEAKHLDAQAATAERLAKAAETEIAAGTDQQGRAKVAAEYRAQAAQLREQADAVRKSPKPEAKPREAKPDTRPASVKVSRQRAVLNVAAIVAFDAGKALKAGTKVGNKRLGAMVDKALVRVPWMKGDREAIVRSARAILKDAGKDPAKIEAAHAAAAEELSKRATAIREAKKARGALVADMFKDSPDAKISGKQAMKERMREVGKTVGKMATAAGRTVIKAIRQTKQAGRAEAAAKIADLRERIKGERKRQADMRRIETRGAVDAAKDAARDQAAMQQGFRDELVRLIRENMPRELRGKYLTAVRDVKTLARLGIEAGKLERDLLGYMARKQLKEAERLAGTARDKAGLERELRDELNKALGALSTVKRKLRGVATGAASVTAATGTTANAKVSQLSAEDLREVIADIEDAAKTIASVRFMQDNMDKVRKNGEVVAGATIRQEMALALASAKDLPAGKDTKIREAGWLLRKLRRRLNWDSLTVMLDGGKGSGPFRQVFNAVRKGREAALRLHHEFQDKIGAIVTANGYDSMGKMLMETSGVLGEALQKTVTANVNGEPTTMTLGQAMYLYASSKDVGFLERIRKGQKVQFVTQRTSDPVSITEADLASVAKALTAKQRTLVDELKAAYDEHYFEKLSRTNKDLKGVFLDKVEGYWGIKLNRTMSEMRGVPTDWRGNYIAALEEAGFMQEREGPSQTPILIGDFGHDILTRSRSASGTIAKAATTKMMMRTVLHPEMVAAITAKYGQQTIEQLTRRVAEWSGGTKYSTAGQVWKELMSMWSRAKTQLRFPTWLRNAAGGSSRMLAEMGVVDVASKAYRPNPAAYRELMQFSPIARERWAGGSAGNFYDTTGEDFADESLKDASVATMRNLAETAKGLMTLDADRAKVGGAGMWKSWKKTLDAITIGNYFDAHGAVVAYRVFLEKAPKDWPEAKRKKWAAGKAMRLFERTANTAKIEFANDVQLDARENMLVGMMTAFTGDTAKAMNMVYQAQARARSGEITWGRAMRTIMALLVGSALSAAIAAAWAAALGKGYDRAKSAAANRFIQEAVSVIPGGGMATNAVQKVLLGIQSDSVLDVPMMDVLNSIKITTVELAKAMDAPTRKVRKTTVTASERYVRALMQGTRVADLAGIPSQYVFDAKAAIDNWGR